MAEYRKVQLYRFARNPVRETAEARFWNAFQAVREGDSLQLSDQVTHLAFSPAAPHNVAVTSGPRMHIYGGSSCRLVKTVSRFKDKAYCPAWRHDGRLVAAGSDDKLVRVFDVKGREILRTFKGHKRPARAVAFAPDGDAVLTGSDDTSVRLWALATGDQTLLLEGHTDYVRCARPSAASSGGSSLFLTGSYDHTVRCWDARAGAAERCVLKLDHGAPVEDVLGLAGGQLLASAGGNRLKIWDALSGRLVYECSNHQKTITALAQDAASSRLATASLDHMVKFYDLGDFSVTHTLKFPAPVLCMGLSPNNRVLAAGMADGTVALRRRSRAGEAAASRGVTAADKRRSLHLALGGDPAASAAENAAALGPALAGPAADGGEAARRSLRTGTYRYYVRGHQHKPADDDLVVDTGRKPRLQEHDRLLKKFQYHEALDAALRTNHAVVVCSVMGELSERGGLRKALSGRDEAGLALVLRFLNRNICNPHYAGALVRAAEAVLDLYGGVLGRSVAVDELFVRLRRKLAEEAAFQKQLLQLSGTLDLLMSAAAASGHAAGVETAPAAAVVTAPAGETRKKRQAPSLAAAAAAEEAETPARKRSKRSRRGKKDEDAAAAVATPRQKGRKGKAAPAEEKAPAPAAEQDEPEQEDKEDVRTPVQLRTRSKRTPARAPAPAPESVRRSTRKRRKVAEE